jgi:phosphoribosylamine--glycine ligase
VKVLVIGGGGKEHALIWKLSRSKHITKIYCSPGNAGIAGIAECIAVSPHNVDALVDFVKYEWIDLTIICSEIFLAQSIVDAFERHGCKLFGLNRGALSLGASRIFLKDFMKRHRLPTAEYQAFSSYLLARDYVQLKGLPLMIKTNEYPGDQGIFCASTLEDAADNLRRIMKEKIYGESGSRVIIEEHLKGERISIVTIADEKGMLPLASVRKYRGRPELDVQSDSTVFGSYSPVPEITKEIEQNMMEKVIYPVHKALSAEGVFFNGFISAELMIQENSVYLLELQFGFGDLEPQTIMPVLKADLGEMILSASEGKLSDSQIRGDEKVSVCFALFSQKDLREESTGSKIKGLDSIKKMEDVYLFHENTMFDNRDIVTPGGTALYITATGTSLDEAKIKAYGAVEKIHFDGMQYRNISGTIP